MPLTTFAGHPLHPQLVELPLGMLPFSFAMDVAYGLTGEESFADAAYYSMVGGVATSLTAAAAGFSDYLSIPPDTHSKKTANVHALLNLGIMGLYGINLFLRKGRKTRTGVLPTFLSMIGTLGLITSSWYGGELVYELGMRVKPLMEGDTGPEAKLPGDEKIERSFRELERQITG